MIIEMVTKPNRPTFISDKQRAAQKRSSLDADKNSKKNASAGGKLGRIARNAQVSLSLAKKIEFVDIVETMIDSPEHSNAEIIEMVRLMQNEMDRVQSRKSNQQQQRPAGQNDDDDDDDDSAKLDYEELFKLFIVKRKIKLLRFLFSLDRKVFDFHPDLFLRSLELEAYDMAALLFKEFFRLLRLMDAQQSEFAVSHIVSSYNKNNGMLDFKAYLARQFTEQMQLRHARALLDAIRNKVKSVSK